MSSDVLEAGSDDIVIVTVNRPEKRNALSLNVLRCLEDIFTARRADTQLRCAIITGAGDKAFASGGDLTELADFRSEEQALHLSTCGRRALNAIRDFPVPVIARLNGVALGGGAELAVACDLRFAAAHAAIGFVHARLAITPSWGGGIDLMRLVGHATGLRLLGCAEVLGAGDALRHGLVDAVAPEGIDFDDAFDAFAARLRAHPPQVMRATKALSRGERLRDRERMEPVETQNFVRTWTSPDHWSAVAALPMRGGR